MRYLAILLLLAPGAFGYVRQVTADGAPLVRVDNTGIQFNLDTSLFAGVQSSLSGATVTVMTSNSDPFGAVRGALADWNALSGVANIKFLALQTTSVGINHSDYIMTIALAKTADDLSVIPTGGLGVTTDYYAAGNGTINGWTVQDGSIIDSDIIVSPSVTFSTTGASGTFDFQSLITHELGHSLGSSHSNLLGTTMYPYSSIGSFANRYLSTDEVALVTAVYPLPATTTGTITGKITTAAILPAPYSMVTMIDQSSGNTYGALADVTGTYSLTLPPASYTVYAEPFNSFVSAGNFYLTATQAASAIAFEPTFLGGALTPTAVNVTANGTATANISVTLGASTLTPPAYVFLPVGASAAGQSLPYIHGPIFLASGQSIDFVFGGVGYDATYTTSNVLIFGGGIQITNLKADTVTLSTGQPLLRATLKIPAITTPGLATLILTKGGNTIAFSGVFIVTPPTPAFTAPAVTNAASGADVAVSPGEIVALYGSSLSQPGNGFSTFFDPNDYLTTILGGTTVTFDGVPAPLIYAGSGQVNLVVPYEVAGETSSKVVITNNGSASAPIAVSVVSDTPGILANPPGSPNALATLATNGTVIAQSNPAPRGSIVTIWGVGAGKPSFTVATGQPAPYAPPYTSSGFTCTVGGQPAGIITAIAPGFVGLVQWNVTLPSATQLTNTGDLPIVITSPSGHTTQAVNIWVN